MRADRLLCRFLGSHIERVHRSRMRALLAAVVALIRGGELNLSRLGRAIAARAKVKHGIKRVDRLYGNEHLGADRISIYRGIAYGVIQGAPRPQVTVDWTDVGEKMCVLAAAVPCSGRAVVIYAETHPLSKYTNPRVESRFLRTLRSVLPQGSKPIVVTDAGFRAPWLRRVVALGWDYVARVRGRAYVRPIDSKPWIRFDDLYLKATRVARDLGHWLVTRYKPYEARLITIRRRRRKWSAGERTRALKAGVPREIEMMREPWLLATSLQSETAAEIVAIYSRRMQIEESFRDTKSTRFGWSLETACTRRASRVDVMMLLTALASLLVLIVGISAEAAGVHRGFQANTVRKRRCLALTTLGRLVLLHACARAAPTNVFPVAFEPLPG